jgi:hypothetical protein
MNLTTTASDELLRQAHRSLLVDLQQLSGATAGMDLSALRTRLLKTRHDLLEHFRLEEQNGYLDVVRTREPCLEPTLARLLAEHRKLLQGLDAILAKLEQPHASPESIQQLVRLWVHDVRGHEIRENDLIQDAFVHDLGAGD